MRRVGNNAVNTQSYYAFLIADTMGEDIGILASLSLSLLFRVPARRGELPIAPEQVVIRVAIQYLLEALTDIGPALTYYAISMLCGVRLHPVTSRMVAESVGVPAAHLAHKRQRRVSTTLPPDTADSSGELAEHTFGAVQMEALSPTGLTQASLLPAGQAQTEQQTNTLATADQGSTDSEGSIIGDMPSLRSLSVSELTEEKAFQGSSAWQLSSSGFGSRATDLEPAPLDLASQVRGIDSVAFPKAKVAGTTAETPMWGAGSQASPGPQRLRDPSLGDGTPATSEANSNAKHWRGVMLREGDPDVVAASAAARAVFARRRLAIASDPIWQPVEMKQLLQLAVFGRPAAPVADRVTGDNADGARIPSHASDASEQAIATAPPRRVLFREVRAASLAQLSTAQYVAAWLALRTELLAVRLSRAWETRVPGWVVLYVFGAFHALNLLARALAGVPIRCPYVDPDGDWYWNFCTAK